MGIIVRTETMQDKIIKANKNFDTLELRNVSYSFKSTVDKDRILRYLKLDKKYAAKEFSDRLKPNLNPGNSWKLRKNVWREFLDPTSKRFEYTYSERLHPDLEETVSMLKKSPNTRRAIIMVFSKEIDTPKRNKLARIPCSIFYHFMKREKKLHLTYVMRSCDFNTHFGYDLWIASKLLEYAARKTKMPAGSLTYFSTSLHIYRKDAAKGVF